MTFQDFMNNPRLPGALHEVERRIYDFDQEFTTHVRSLKDEDVLEAVREARVLIAKEGAEQPPPPAAAPERRPDDEEEATREHLKVALVELRNQLNEGELTEREYAAVLTEAERTITSNHERYGHERGYLEMLRRFVEKGATEM